MTRKELVIKMMESVAPTIIKVGLDLQLRLIDNGNDPAKRKFENILSIEE